VTPYQEPLLQPFSARLLQVGHVKLVRSQIEEQDIQSELAGQLHVLHSTLQGNSREFKPSS